MKKYSFILIVFFLFSLPFLVLSSHFLNMIKDNSRKDMLYYLNLNTQVMSSRVSEILNEKYDVLQVVRDKKFINDSLKEKENKINEIKEKNKDIVREIQIISPEGQELFSTLKDKKKINYKDNPVFINAKFDAFSVGSVVYYENKPPQLTLAEPLIKIKGEKPQYVLMAHLSLSYLINYLNKMFVKNIGKVFLFDSNGQVICDSEFNYFSVSGFFANEKIKNIIEDLKKENLNSFTGEVILDDMPFLISLEKVESTQWWLFESIEENKIINYYLYSWAKKVIFLGLIIIGVFSFITYKITKTMFKI